MTRQTSRTLTFVFASVALCVATIHAQGRFVPLPVAPPGSVASVQAPGPPVFWVRSYLGKCLDFGQPSNPVSQVVIFDCNGSASQRITVEEVDSQHDVVLHAGNWVLGVNSGPLVATLGGSNTVPTGGSTIVYGLELQARNTLTAVTMTAQTMGQHNQVFALDGDSIILASNRNLVVQVQNGRGANGSPLVVAQRNLADSEFWDFDAIDGSGRYPTSGFATATTADELASRVSTAGWGSVIVINPRTQCFIEGVYDSSCIELSGYPPFALTDGVTIRGNRRGTLFGPELYGNYSPGNSHTNMCANCFFEIRGNYVRVTGLRMRGQASYTKELSVGADAIVVDYVGQDRGAPAFSDTTLTEYIATIDHNDISYWPDAAVVINTPYSADDHNHCGVVLSTYPPKSASYSCGSLPSGSILEAATVPDDPRNPKNSVPVANDPGTLGNVRISRNFVHHNSNATDDDGYGVNLGRALVDGNTFLMNRHAITSGGEPHNEYRAANNLVLSNAPSYGSTVNQDFDMHGTDWPKHFVGGEAGFYVDIVGNTFLGTNRSPYWLRGWPVHATDFHRNVSLNGKGAVEFRHCWPGCIDINFTPPLNIFDSRFKDSSPAYTDPTVRLGVGDFDGDGIEDLFLATGAAWYYSPGGAREWRFLNSAPNPIDQLLLGDFDGDGRTDVVAVENGQFLVSWGGISDWEVLNANPTGGRVLLLPSAAASMMVGDFDGDGRADIFWADGGTWWISYSGTTQFVQVIVSSNLLVSDLRFGDFNGDGATDVFGVVDGHWSVRYGFKGFRGFLGGWQPLPVSLTKTVDGLFVADFAGIGRAAVAKVCDGAPNSWCIAEQTSTSWREYSVGLNAVAAVGHFEGRVDVNRRPLPAEILLWNGKDLTSFKADTIAGETQPHSSQEMR